MIEARKASRREIFGWSMFDFANQAYTLLIISVIFGDLYVRVIVGDGPEHRLGNLLWSAALCLSYAVVVITAPLLGAIMDATRTRKKMLFASYAITVISTALLYFVEPGALWLGFLLIVVSNAAYATGESIIASFLPFLGPSRNLGRISGLGWATGYAGGLVAAGIALAALGETSLENFDRVRWVGPFAAAFFLLGAIPSFLWLKEPAGELSPLPNTRILRLTHQRLLATLARVRAYPDLARLFVSILFAMAGVQIIVAFAFIYGAQVIGWSDSTRALMFVVVQLTALTGALAFGALQSRLGGRLSYALTLLLWIVAIVAIHFVNELTALVNRSFALSLLTEEVFLFAGLVSGLSLGSSQSVGRALVGMFAPAHRSAELFGYWGLFSKLAAIFGILGIGILQWAFGLQGAILFCILLFAAALVPVLGIDEARAIAAARETRRVR